MGRALLANPIFAVVAAIAAAAFLIYDNWETVGPFFAKLWDGVKSLFTAGFEFIKSYFLNFTPLGLIVQNWEPIVTYFSGLWDRVKGFVEPLLAGARSVASGISNFIGGGSTSPSPIASSRGPLAGALAAGGQTKLNGELVVRFQDAPAGTRVDPGTSNQPGVSINPDVGYRSQLAF